MEEEILTAIRLLGHIKEREKKIKREEEDKRNTSEKNWKLRKNCSLNII